VAQIPVPFCHGDIPREEVVTMLIHNIGGAANLVGFPVRHAEIFQVVADQLDVVIISRAIGATCTGLIEEHYGLKGFRIDTKSCNWGPMAGFVCVDPNLNKFGTAKAGFNRHETADAVAGTVSMARFGVNRQQVASAVADWSAGTCPLIISGDRVDDLVNNLRLITIKQAHDNGHKSGECNEAGVRLPWRLVPLKQVLEKAVAGSNPGNHVVKNAWDAARVKPGGPDHYYVICVNRFLLAGDGCKLEYPAGTSAVYVQVGSNRFETILGLTNPGTASLGFKACVTGDYDLFAAWPRREQFGHAFNRPTLTTQGSFDARPQDRRGQMESFLVGNISTRLNIVKVRLNTLLQFEGGGGFQGGQCVHHSDEIGNPNVLLQKDLAECLPMIAFSPQRSGSRFGGAWGISHDLPSFFDFANLCNENGYAVELRRPAWIQQYRSYYARARRNAGGPWRPDPNPPTFR
jgi:hypothetical protein